MDVHLPSSWDALRKQARKLEAQLDEQMVSYRRLVATKVDSTANDIESGIDHLLKQLDQVNNQMREWVSSGDIEMVSHTFTRHQEILQDLTQEFYRLRSSVRAKQEHASLLQDFREFDRSRLDLEEGENSTEHALLKEHVSIGRSTGQVLGFPSFFTLMYGIGIRGIQVSSGCFLVVGIFTICLYQFWNLCTPKGKELSMDSVISHAQSTLGTLVHQRSTFGGINSKLSNVSSRLPTVNQIIGSIKRKKSMDAIILSLVASVCTFLILIYWLSK